MGLNFSELQPPSEEARKAAEAYREALTQAEIRDRETLLVWAFIMCTCTPAYIRVDLQTPPGYSACLVHGQHLMTKDGRWL